MKDSLRILLFITVLFITVKTDYDPQMMFTITSESINKGLIKHLGVNISAAINNYTIVVPVQTETVAGVKVTFNLTDVKQKVDITWKGNVLTVKDRHTIAINTKNINVTLNGHLEYKAGITRRQKG